MGVVKQVKGRTKLRLPKPERRVQSPLDKARPFEVVWQQVSSLFEAMRGVEDASFVYFIGEVDDGPLKIGVAKDPIKRVRAMQTGNPRRLRIEYILAGDGDLEKLLHEFWEPFAIISAAKEGKLDAAPGTEWFRPEIRETLLPIVETAAFEQMCFLRDHPDDADFEDMERIVRDAHKEHDFVVQGRDEVRLLGRASGYAVNRPSRI